MKKNSITTQEGWIVHYSESKDCNLDGAENHLGPKEGVEGETLYNLIRCAFRGLEHEMEYGESVAKCLKVSITYMRILWGVAGFQKARESFESLISAAQREIADKITVTVEEDDIYSDIKCDLDALQKAKNFLRLAEKIDERQLALRG